MSVSEGDATNYRHGGVFWDSIRFTRKRITGLIKR